MAPPVATLTPTFDVDVDVNYLKKNVADKAAYDVLEDYDGNYRFAPIEEAEVSRAMIKRYAHTDTRSQLAPFLPPSHRCIDPALAPASFVSRSQPTSQILQHHVRQSRL